MINRQTITSTTSGLDYTLYFYEDELKGCSCKHRHFHPFTDCKHMTAYKQQQADEKRTAYNNYCLAMNI